jgi:hypothetical protein
MASFARPQNSQKYEVPADVKAAFTADEIKQYLRTFKGFDSDSDGEVQSFGIGYAARLVRAVALRFLLIALLHITAYTSQAA